MKFSDIVGQDEVKKNIISLIKEGRMPHALAFCGVQGVGKLALALATAQYLCCENPNDEDSCGVCPSCVKYAKLAHPDLHFTFPYAAKEGGPKRCDDLVEQFRTAVIENPYLTVRSWLDKVSDGKNGMIYKSDGDEIIRKISLKPYESNCQVMIIWCHDRMNLDCSNHILKFLEEPPANTYFLCVSCNPNQIIATIKSRTQQINVPPIPTEAIMEKAKQVYQLPMEQLHSAARLSHGSWGLFNDEITNEGDKQELFQQFMTFMRLSWTLNMRDLKAWSEYMGSLSRDKQKNFLELAQNQIRENFILRLQSPELNYMNMNEKNFAAKFSQFIHENNIEDMMEALQVAADQIEQNVNSKIIFLHLPFILYRLIKRNND